MLGGAYRFTDGHLAAIVQMYEMMPSPLGNAQGRRLRSRPARKPAQAAGNGVAPLRPRPRNRRHNSDFTGPSAA